MNKATGQNLPPLVWEIVSIINGLDVIELWGDEARRIWCAAVAMQEALS